MKSGADLEKASDPPAQPRPTFGGLRDAAENLEQRALASPMSSDDTDSLAFLHLEADIFQRPEFLDFVALNNLSAVEQIYRLTQEISRLSSNDVPQRRIMLSLSGLVTDQIPFRQFFYR